MKAVLVLVALVAVVALSSAEYSHTDGQPLCTKTNANTKFRNNWDPTRYWLCTDIVRSDALSVLCPSQTGFMDSKKDCVSWAEWKWEEPYDPPTA